MNVKKEQITLNSKVKISDEVITRNIDGEILLLNLQTNGYYGLNDIGTRIWDLLKEYKSLEKVTGLFLEEYEINEEDFKKDLISFVTTLKQNQFIEV